MITRMKRTAEQFGESNVASIRDKLLVVMLSSYCQTERE